MERADARPVTRSRRSMLGDILEKENVDTPPSTPSKKRSSVSPKIDSDEMEPVQISKLAKDMEDKIRASPARVTRGRRSISLNEIPPESPSRNLRKRTVSPESKPTPRKKTSPKSESSSQEDKSGTLVEMTPNKKNSRLAIGSLATVDSPKPRKTRQSLSDLGLIAETQNLRRSRRLSTELNVLQEDPIREAQVEDPTPIVKTRRGKRLSVLPTQPSVPEEMEVDEDFKTNLSAQLNNSTKSDFITTADGSNTVTKSPKKKEMKIDDHEDTLNVSKRRTLTPQRVNVSLNKSETNETSLSVGNDAVIEDNDANKSKRKTLTPRRANLSLNKSKTNDTSLDEVMDSVNEAEVNKSKDKIETPQRTKLSLNKSKTNDTSLDGVTDSIDEEVNKSKRRTQTPQRANLSLNKSKTNDIFLEDDKDFVNEEDTEVDDSKLKTPQRGNVSLNKSKSKDTSLNEDEDLKKSKRRTLTPQRVNESLNKSKSNTSLTKQDNDEGDCISDVSKRQSLTPRANLSSNKSKTNISFNSSKIEKSEDNNISIKSKRGTLTPQRTNNSLNTSATNEGNLNFKENVDLSNILNSSNCVNVTPSSKNNAEEISSITANEGDGCSKVLNLLDEDNDVLNASKCKVLTPHVDLSTTGVDKLDQINSNDHKDDVDENLEVDHDANDVQHCLDINKDDTVKSQSNESNLKNSACSSSSMSTEGTLIKLFLEDSAKKNASAQMHNLSSKSNNSRTTAKEIFMNESNEEISNEEIADTKKEMPKGIALNKNISTSTPVMKSSKSLEKIKSDESMDKSIDDTSPNKSSLSITIATLDSADESYDSSSEEEDGSNLVNSEAIDAGMDYQSGDSMDESERILMEDNALIERGESLHSDTDEEDDDDSYEKDSFLCSSEDEEMVLSGSGDDLSSGEELTQSQSSKAKHNKKQEKIQKNASREMYNARHSLDESTLNSSQKKKYNNIKPLESDSDSAAENDEKEVTNVGFNVSGKNECSKDPLTLEDDDLTESSDEEDLKNVTKLYNEELERLRNICVETDSDVSEDKIESDKTESFTKMKNKSDNLNNSNKSPKKDAKTITPKKDIVEDDLNISKISKRSSKGNKSLNLSKDNKSLNLSKDNKSLNLSKDNALEKTAESVKENLNEMDRLFNISSKLSKVFNNLLNDVDILKSTVNENTLKCSNADVSSSEQNKNESIRSIESAKKRKLSSLDDGLRDNDSNKVQRTADVSDDELITSAVVDIVNKDDSGEISDAPETVDVIKSDKTKKKEFKNLMPKMKVHNLDRSEIVSGFRVKPIKTKSTAKIVSTSEFDVEELESDAASCTNTAGSFVVSSKSKRKQLSADRINSTTSFNVVSLKKNPKHVTRVDDRFKAGFVNFKQEMMYGKSVKRESSSDLIKKQNKLNAYRRTPY